MKIKDIAKNLKFKKFGDSIGGGKVFAKPDPPIKEPIPIPIEPPPFDPTNPIPVPKPIKPPKEDQ